MLRSSLGGILLWVYLDADPRGSIGPEVWGSLGVRYWDIDDGSPNLAHSSGGQHQCVVSCGGQGSGRVL